MVLGVNMSWAAIADNREKLLIQEFAIEQQNVTDEIFTVTRTSNVTEPLRPFIFIHLPKCAGSSIRASALISSQAALMLWDVPDDRQLTMFQQFLQSGIVGHFPYGYHFFFPPNKQPAYATILRHPIDRVLSHYEYHRYEIRDPNHVYAVTMTLTEWVKTSVNGQNRMVQFISGLEGRVPTSPEVLEMAKQHLKKFKYVGLVEEFEKSWVMLQWRVQGTQQYASNRMRMSSLPANQNINRRRRKVESLTEEERNAIIEANQMDMELYELARHMFWAQWNDFMSEGFKPRK